MAEAAASDMIRWADRWLSADRLAPYLAACGGDCVRALRLHEWNISLGQVLMRDVAHLEAARLHGGETPVEGFLGVNPAPADVWL